jgi:hypothetical protein
MNARRCATAQDAAAYLSIPVAEFLRRPIGEVRFGARVRYDLRAIDAHLDRLSGLAPSSPAAHPDDAEAAFDRSFRPVLSHDARRS